MLGQKNRHEVQCVLRFQCLAAAIVPILILLIANKAAACSALYGALVSVVPTWVFALMLFRYQGARQAQRIIRSLYVGEGMKLLLTAFLFGAVIYFLKPIWWAFFAGFFLVYMSLCFAPLYCAR